MPAHELLLPQLATIKRQDPTVREVSVEVCLGVEVDLTPNLWVSDVHTPVRAQLFSHHLSSVRDMGVILSVSQSNLLPSPSAPPSETHTQIHTPTHTAMHDIYGVYKTTNHVKCVKAG